MSTAHPSTLEEAIRHSGEGWLIDRFMPPEDAMSHLRQTLASVNRRAQVLLGGKAPDLSETTIVGEYNRSPHQVQGFFQALAGTRTPDMLLMVWRIIQGMEIKSVELSYHRQMDFRVSAILESPYGDEDEEYSSSSINDFTLFRHIGILEIGGRPVFDGFYALRVRGMTQ